MRDCILLIARYMLLGGILLIVFSCGEREESFRSTRKKTTQTLSDLGALPLTVTHPADNPTSEKKIELGRLLFYDPILSGNRDVACATCHQPEFNYAEFMETSIGVNGVGNGTKRRFVNPNDIPFVRRNSQSVLNTAFNGITTHGPYHAEKAPMFWDLRAKSLEEQALLPIKTLEEMRGKGFGEEEIIDEILSRIQKIPLYQTLFSEAFPGDRPAVNEKNLGRALATFERTLIANNSRFDQYMRGDSSALSRNEKEGLNLFLKTGCAGCHAGPMLSDYKLHTLGVPDTKNRPEPDSGINGDFAFRTPSLRNLRYTAPYMHSGKFATLERVMQFYEDLAGGKSANPAVPISKVDTLATDMTVNFRDISLIIEFLSTLNDDNFDKTVPDRVPSGLKVKGDID